MRSIKKSGMHYHIELDPTHSVIRLTIKEQTVSLECAEDFYQRLKQIASEGGPYAAIYDLSIPRDTSIPTDMVRRFAWRPPAIPMGRPHVIVGKAPVILGLARLFQLCEELLGREFTVVQTVEEAYAIVGARSKDFTKLVYPAKPRMAA